MTMDKAIEILQAKIDCHEEANPRDVYNATKLGIEALRFYRELKHTRNLKVALLLPGETEN